MNTDDQNTFGSDEDVNENPVVTGDESNADDVVELNDVQENNPVGEALNEIEAGDGAGDEQADAELAEELANDAQGDVVASDVNEQESPAADEAAALAAGSEDPVVPIAGVTPESEFLGKPDLQKMYGNDNELPASDEGDIEAAYANSASAPEDAINAKVVQLRADGIRHKRLSKTKVIYD